MLLCTVVSKYKPSGRNMWESVAVEYSSLRARSWSERDYDSLRQKFRTLYGKPKPTGSQGEEVPLRHRPVLMAHEIQAAIELKGGAHTSHDGCDRGEDDEQLLKDVDAATLAARGFNEDEEDVDSESDEMNSETAPNRDVAEDVGNPTGEHQSPSREEDSQEDLSISTAMGTVITSRGTFDMSLANDVWSDENDEDPDSSEETRTLDQDASAGLHTPNVPRTSTSRAVGRPKDNRGAQCSQISPRDPPYLTRDPNKAAQDAAEARTKKKLRVIDLVVLTCAY